MTLLVASGAGRARKQGARTDVRRHLPLLQQPLQPAPQLVDNLLLASLAVGELHRRLLHPDAELLGPGHGAEHRRRFEELLSGDASSVQAGAADFLLLDHRNPQAGQAAPQRRRIAGRSAADNHYIERLGRRNHLLDQPGSLLPARGMSSLPHGRHTLRSSVRAEEVDG